MAVVNIGIVAHVDAGKTSLTERILFETGVTDTLGSVDAGSTHTDALELERERGITIESAVVSFRLGDMKVNLIDTPGHSDFIAEVERALGVLDGAVLVVSAVEGVQPQTRRLMRTLNRLRTPTVLFVNKVDRAGARCAELPDEIAGRLSPHIAVLSTVAAAGTRHAGVTPRALTDPRLAGPLAELLADHDDRFLTEYLRDGWRPDAARLAAQLRAATGRGTVHPVYFGSAVTGAGVPDLLAGIATYLPPAPEADTGPLSGTVFKVQRGAGGQKLAHVRLRTGRLRVRGRVPVFRRDAAGRLAEHDGRVTAVEVFADGSIVPAASAGAGEIVRVTGLHDVRISDQLGSPPAEGPRSYFAPPGLESVVTPLDPRDGPRLYAALRELADRDPMIGIRSGGRDREVSVRLFGEVQKEVIAATLVREFGVAAAFGPTRTTYLERPVGAGAAVEYIDPPDNPFFATVGLRVEPGPRSGGVEYRLAVELGGLPLSFHKAIEETVRDTLHEGLSGWEVTDCLVTLTHSGYAAPLSTASDFRRLTPLVLMAALREAGTRVYEPTRRFTLDVPPPCVGDVIAGLAQARAVPHGVDTAEGSSRVFGVIPVGAVYEFERRLPRLSRGEGDLALSPGADEPVTGAPPRRDRTDHNPLDRAEYLRGL
ncbi:MAG: translation factor GTPase family protein, partial [Actinocatenispora sp.]